MIFSDYEMPYQMYIYDKVSIRKTFAQFLRKKAQIFAFVALDFCAKKTSTCTINRKLNLYCTIFLEQILSKRLNKCVNAA